MPLLMCPNCAVSTEQVRRHEIEIDMCPRCRGVWMDRGELEKILDLERAELAPPLDYVRPMPSPWPDRHRHNDHKPRRDHDDDRHDYKRHGHKRRSFLDFFDD